MQFFFDFEIVAAGGLDESEKPYKVLDFLPGEAFESFYQYFDLNGSLSDRGADYEADKRCF